MASFLSHLFHVKKLKLSTISHYRSALSRPLLDYFKVNLNCPQIQFLLRGMRIRRPHEPSPKPQWSLTKVLTLLEKVINSTETCSPRKTTFLLLLATGWRISEVHACVRRRGIFLFQWKRFITHQTTHSLPNQEWSKEKDRTKRNKNPSRF